MNKKFLVYTHNLNDTEGMPLIAFQIAKFFFLKYHGDINVISPTDGALRIKYINELNAKVFILSKPQSTVDKVLTKIPLLRILCLLKLIISIRPSLVLANTVLAYEFVIVARLARCNILWHIQEPNHPQHTTIKSKKGKILAKIAFLMANHFVFATETTQDSWKSFYKNIHSSIIPNGIDKSKIDEYLLKTKDNTKIDLGLNSNAKICTVVGTTEQRKGQHIFMEAAIKLLNTGFNCQMLIVGASKGEFLDRLIEKVKVAGYQHKIIFIEKRADIFSFYRVSDIFCCPSYIESFPRVIIEAMAFGLPIIASNISGISEQIENGKSGLLIPPGNSELLASKIQYLLEKPQVAEKLGQSARKRFESHFTEDAVKEKYNKLFQDLIIK